MYSGNLENTLKLGGDIFDHVEGCDLFNSNLIFQLDKSTKYSVFPVTSNQKRLDLINDTIYSLSYNYGLLGLVNRIMDPSDIQLGMIIKYFDDDSLSEIFGGVI